MTTVYAFDFDGTVTTRDTLLLFIRHVFGLPRMVLGFALNLPWLFLMRLGLYDNGKTKQRVFSHFFRGMTEQRFNDLCRSFAAARRAVLRPEMSALLKRLHDDRADVVVVSASVVNWVRPFFPDATVTVVGTEVEIADGCLTGRFSTPNCYGGEKVRRLLAVRPHRDSYRLVAYGDSRGDRELLAFADVAYYKQKPFDPKL